MILGPDPLFAIKASLTPISLNLFNILAEVSLLLDKQTIDPPPPEPTILEANDQFLSAISNIRSISGVVIFKSFFKKL